MTSGTIADKLGSKLNSNAYVKSYSKVIKHKVFKNQKQQPIRQIVRKLNDNIQFFVKQANSKTSIGSKIKKFTLASRACRIYVKKNMKEGGLKLLPIEDLKKRNSKRKKMWNVHSVKIRGKNTLIDKRWNINQIIIIEDYDSRRRLNNFAIYNSKTKLKEIIILTYYEFSFETTCS